MKKLALVTAILVLLAPSFAAAEWTTSNWATSQASSFYIMVDGVGNEGHIRGITAPTTETVLAAGTHRLAFRAHQLPSGIYFVRASAGGDVAQRKLVVVM